MASGDTLYTARFLYPEWIERNRNNTIKCPVYRDGALSAPSSGSVVITKADGTPLAFSGAVTVVASVAQLILTAAELPASFSVEDGWIVEWALLMPDSTTHTFRNEAGLVRRRLYPVVTDADLIRRHSDLGDLRPSTMTSYQDYIDEAWASIEGRLLAEGVRSALIISASAFREVHLYKTLEFIFTDFHASVGDGKWLELANQYGKLYWSSWQNLRFTVDRDDDGQMDSTDRTAAKSTIWLNSRGGGQWLV